MLFAAFLLQLAQGDKHVGGAPGSAEATLSIGVHKLCQHLQSAQDDSHKGFAYNTEQRDTAVVATVTAITTILVHCDVPHVLTLLPPLSTGREVRGVW